MQPPMVDLRMYVDTKYRDYKPTGTFAHITMQKYVHMLLYVCRAKLSIYDLKPMIISDLMNFRGIPPTINLLFSMPRGQPQSYEKGLIMPGGQQASDHVATSACWVLHY